MWWLTVQSRQCVPRTPHYRTKVTLHLLLGCRARIVDVSEPPSVADPLGLSWPQDYEVGRWLGCPSDSDGWYGPDGGGHADMTPEEWAGSSGALNGNGWIHYAVPYDHLICNGISHLVSSHFGLKTVVRAR